MCKAERNSWFGKSHILSLFLGCQTVATSDLNDKMPAYKPKEKLMLIYLLSHI